MIHFEIPGAPPLLLNSRLPWRKLNKMKRQWEGWVHIALGRQGPSVPFDKVEVRYVRYCGYIQPDQDNLASGFKWIQDQLVRSGVVVDDKPTNLVAYHEWSPASPQAKRILVEIAPVLGVSDL